MDHPAVSHGIISDGASSEALVFRAEELAFPAVGILSESNRTSYEIRTFTDITEHTIATSTLADLAKLYCQIFNESWGESWTIASATSEILANIVTSPTRTTVMSLMYANGQLRGFSWGYLMDVFALSASREMPYSLSADDRRDGLARTHYFFKSVLNVDRILFIKEIGIHKHYRSTQAPSLVNPLFRFATSKNVKAFLFWTNSKTDAFKWGIGVRWIPFHFFIHDDLVLMTGNICHSLEFSNVITDPSKARPGMRQVIHNIDRFYCR